MPHAPTPPEPPVAPPPRLTPEEAEAAGAAHHLRCIREDINAMKLAGAKVPEHFYKALSEITGEDIEVLRAAPPISQEEFDDLHPEVTAYARRAADTS